jgi:transposase
MLSPNDGRPRTLGVVLLISNAVPGRFRTDTTRTLLVQGAHHILGPFGADSDLRRWGLKLAERGGKSGKKRAIIAVARKLAVLLHHLWVSGEVYEPLRHSKPRAMPAAA